MKRLLPILTAVVCLMALSTAAMAQTPGIPSNLCSKFEVGLAWDANKEGDLAGYKVHQGSQSGQYTAVADVGKVTTYSVPVMGVGQYFFAVTAYNASGTESGFSNEVSQLVLPGNVTVPAAPNVTGPNVVDLTSTTVQLSWKTVKATKARIEYQTAGGTFNSLAVDAIEVTDHYVRIAGLQPGRVYTYTVINETGTERFDATGSFRTR